MTPVVIFLLVGGSCLFFLAGAYLVGWLLLSKWSRLQSEQWGKREAFYAKMVDKAKTQFRTSMQGLPERTGRVARDVIDHLLKEEVEAEVVE